MPLFPWVGPPLASEEHVRKSKMETVSPVSSLRGGRQEQRAALRYQILDAAAKIIAAEGVEALSMRRLGQALNCAPMSLYSYFGDKHALLLALAHRSFDALAHRLTEQSSDAPLEALQGLFLAYAKFAFENPSEYCTIFMTPEAQPKHEAKSPDDIFAENLAFASSVERVRACVEVGLLAGDAHAIATFLWTSVHGAVAAVLCFPAFPFGEPTAYVAKVVDLLIRALETDAVEPLV